MNPKTNVRLLQFWQLHFFINVKFEEQLARYSASNPVASVATSLEASPQAPLI